jgi:hypothetical protein
MQAWNCNPESGMKYTCWYENTNVDNKIPLWNDIADLVANISKQFLNLKEKLQLWKHHSSYDF